MTLTILGLQHSYRDSKEVDEDPIMRMKENVVDTSLRISFPAFNNRSRYLLSSLFGVLEMDKSIGSDVAGYCRCCVNVVFGTRLIV